MDNQTNQFNVKSFRIKQIEVLPQAIGELNIYESLQSPAIVGDFTIADWQGFDEVGEIFGGDDFEVIFSTEEQTELSLKYKIYASDLKVDSGNTFNITHYKFCSPWLIDGLTRQISKHYKDKYIHEIVQDLLTECGAKIGYIEPTKQKLNHYTTPLWTAIHSISRLSSMAMNENDVGGYICWPDLKTDKVNFTTMDYLYQGKAGILEKPFTSVSPNQFYENRIDTLGFETNFDVIKYINQGMNKTRYDGYFRDKNLVFSTKESINQIPHTHLSKKIPIDKKYTDKKYDSIHPCLLHPTTDSLMPLTTYTDLINGYMKYRYMLLFSDVFKINMLTNPASNRRVGNLCKLDYQSQDVPKSKTDAQYTGDYVIREIRHAIFNSGYSQIITIIGDGYKMSTRDLVEWKP